MANSESCTLGWATTSIDYSPYSGLSCFGTESISSKKQPQKEIVGMTKIKGIYPQEKKRLVVVKFQDNSIVKLQCHSEDEFNVEVATALAIAYKMYGSKGEFRRQVEKISGIKRGE